MDCTILFMTEGMPEYIRSDNGSEFTARTVQKCQHQWFGYRTYMTTSPSQIEEGIFLRNIPSSIPKY
ncbi:MAG: transposase family protein [Candidatus Gastranaerophilales bacterium]|nr:transposase family protein [Candidatus Gastranaerophilales bacterium]